ncbi:MAG: glycosyltransferase family 4 protein [Roseiflexaceae bacterium]|nr:glycosyltransferase family 4 protein [Roseiflexaceae bacterium]
MRIALATHFFPPGHLGGTEVLTMSLAKSLQDAGHTVQVICAEDWETAPGYTIDAVDDVFQEIQVRRLRFNWMKAPDVFTYLYNNPEVKHCFTSFLRSFKPDIVHITSCYSLSASIISAAAELGLPIVLTATDFWFLCARNTLLQPDGSLCGGPTDPLKCTRCMASNAKIYRWPGKFLPEPTVVALLRFLGRYPLVTRQPGLRGMVGDWDKRKKFLLRALEKVDRIVTASQFLRSLFITYGVTPEKLTFSTYGLDTAWARGYETKTPSDRLRIGFIGQIVPFKGPDILLRAVQSLPSDAPVSVIIYGNLEKDPKYGQQLRAMAAHDPRVRFAGTFENNRMGEVLTEIDVLAVPSTWYDFPLVVSSALATKTPVLATDLPGMNELIVHERNGLLFGRYDWAGLAALIRRLIDDPALLPRLREGIAPAKTVKEMREEYESIYASLVSYENGRVKEWGAAPSRQVV